MRAKASDRFGRHISLAAAFVLVVSGFTFFELEPAHAAPVVVNSIQKGTATLGGGSASTAAVITAVDPSRAFLVFSVRENLGDPESGTVTGRLASPTSVVFERIGTTGTITLEWSVVDFASGVSVQRGTLAMGATTVNVPISAVDLAKSFPIVSMRAGGTVFSDDDFLRARLTATNNLELSTLNLNANVAEWQVVQYDGASVQSGDLSFGAGDTTRNATVTSVDTSKSWLIYSYRSNYSAMQNIGEKLLRGTISDSTTLTFDRSVSGTTNDLSWYLVEFTDATAVQHGSAAFGSSDTSKDVTITAVDSASSISVGGYQMTGGRSPYATNDVPGVGWFTLELTSGTNLHIERSAALAAADLGWYVIEWGDANVAPTANDDPDSGTIDVNEGGSFLIDVLANDTDPDDGIDPTTVVATNGTNGTTSVNPVTGVVTYTHGGSETLGDTFTYTVRDLAGELSNAATVTITVLAQNDSPVLDAVGSQSGVEGTLITFTATASDSDVPANTLTFTLEDGAGSVPAGAVITAGGVFTFTPSEAQGPGVFSFDVVVTDDGAGLLEDRETITVTVGEVSVAPVLDPVGPQSGDEGTLITFTATASDSDVPGSVTFTLEDGTGAVPAGAVITAGGAFTWIPTEAQGPGVYTFDVVVTDNTLLEDRETITVTVNEVNVAPVLVPVGPQSGDEGSLIGFTATASDADVPANTLTFTLEDGTGSVPAGASITAGGVFTWTPTEAQGPGVYTFDVVVTDDGAGLLEDRETITVTVGEANIAPVLNVVGAQSGDEGTLIGFTATATDADFPANALTFTLEDGAGTIPAGASITAGGVFTFTPTEAQGPGV